MYLEHVLELGSVHILRDIGPNHLVGLDIFFVLKKSQIDIHLTMAMHQGGRKQIFYGGATVNSEK